jgi:DNA invertase Pin-like site-specific DNA recombinase
MIRRKKALGYIRISTKHQEREPSLDNQATLIREWAKLNGYDLLRTYEDVASGRRSGSAVRRHGLQQLIDEANREGAVILVTRLDRLTRNSKDVEAILKQFRGRIIPVVDEDMSSKPLSKQRIRTDVAGAQVTAEVRAEQTSAALRRKARSGMHLGSPVDKRAAALASAKARRISSDIALEQIARVLAESPAHGKMSTRELADLLNSRRFFSGSGKPWTLEGLRRPRRAALRLLQDQAELDAEEDAGPFAPAAIQTDGFHHPAAAHAVEQASRGQDASQPPAEGAGAVERSENEEERPYANHPLFGIF